MKKVCGRVGRLIYATTTNNTENEIINSKFAESVLAAGGWRRVGRCFYGCIFVAIGGVDSWSLADLPLPKFARRI